jgi:hypothetical protein
MGCKGGARRGVDACFEIVCAQYVGAFCVTCGVGMCVCVPRARPKSKIGQVNSHIWHERVGMCVCVCVCVRVCACVFVTLLHKRVGMCVCE